MRYIKQLFELSKESVLEAGGKGASLGEMVRAGLPVPPGFVVLASAFEKFLADADLGVEIAAILDTVDTSAMHTVEHASEKIQKLILTEEFSPNLGKEILLAFSALGAEFVAVRSSATAEDSAGAAWAGQLETYLNTTKEDLLKNIQKCWTSLYTPRAIFYGFEKGFLGSKHRTENSKQEEVGSNQQSAVGDQMSNVKGQGSISVAVVVQAMVQSEVAGIAFSVHPVTEDRNQLIIEAGYGLGEAVVSGQVTPDSYVVTKEPLEIADRNISEQQKMLVRSSGGGNEWVDANQRMLANDANDSKSGRKQKLSDEQILELAKIIVKIEQHYGTPQDIEWALISDPEQGPRGAFYITQSRPITTLGSSTKTGGISMMPDSYNYEYSWGGSGFSVLFLSLFHHGIAKYGFADSVSVVENGSLRVYWSQDSIKKATEYGSKLFLNIETARQQCSRIDAMMGNMEAANITVENTIEYLKLCVDFLAEYITLDPEFTTNIPSLHRNENLLSYLGEEKNKFREKINQLFFNKNSYWSEFLERVSFLYGWDRNFIENMTLEELVECMNNQNMLSVGDRDNFIISTKFGVVHYQFNDTNVKDFIAMLEDPQDSYKDYLTGVSVSKTGVYHGKVKVYSMDYKAIDSVIEAHNKVGEGYVFVADHTSPELVPILSKSIAVVVNMSGILSHAAITARELNIPCIVGTKIATQVLHDGDLVEVDADNGIVRVLERAKSN